MTEERATGEQAIEEQAAGEQTTEEQAAEEQTTEEEAENDGITARYYETDDERVLEFEADGTTAAIAQNVEGYAMLKVRPTADGDELERYYGFDMALDHAAELLGSSPHDLPVPQAAADMGM